MEGASDMRLLHFQVNKTLFELNSHYVIKSKNISIQPIFNRDITKISDSQFSIKIGVSILAKEHKNPIPFSAEVIIQGFFEFQKWEDDDARPIIIDNATAILFPYLRNLLATLTLNGNIPPYTLPIVNVTRLFVAESN